MKFSCQYPAFNLFFTAYLIPQRRLSGNSPPKTAVFAAAFRGEFPSMPSATPVVAFLSIPAQRTPEPQHYWPSCGEHNPRTRLLEVATLLLDAREALIYGITGPLRHSTTFKLKSLPVVANAFIRSSKSHAKAEKTSSDLCLVWRANECRLITPIGTSERSD